MTPASRDVAKDTGTATFNVSNTGTTTMPWTAQVTSGNSWLSITSGASGSDTGIITCAFDANTTASSRTGLVRVAASGAVGTPVDVTVTQAGTSTGCAATLDGNLLLHIPYLSYADPISGTISLWADFVYEFNPAYPTLNTFKLTNDGIWDNPSFSCEASTLSSDLKIHIPDVLLPDGSTHTWVNLEYDSALSGDGNTYFSVTTYGVISN
ncbi:MAG: BACON domain-containing protein [Deltaproteobacteria bacterium]|nr:BACON domain-containing protein [Deltaproteobacteria bacterium]